MKLLLIFLLLVVAFFIGVYVGTKPEKPRKGLTPNIWWGNDYSDDED